MRFMRMEVMRPARLFRKLGLPQDTISRSMAGFSRGRMKRSSACPRKKGTKAMTAHTIIPVQVPRAAPQIPQRNTPRNRNSSPALRADMNRLRNMLPRM